MTDATASKAAFVVQLSGGEIVGRTRFQKTTCLLEMAGADLGFKFNYHLYGPYSDELSIAVSDAGALNWLDVKDHETSWGGRFSVFRYIADPQPVPSRSFEELAHVAASADSIVLELAVTAAFLAKNGSPDPWMEVASRKSGKATADRLANAKALYQRLAAIATPTRLPALRDS